MHVCPNGKKYIGITGTSVKRRWMNGFGYASQKLFNRAIQKYGWDNIEHLILFEHLIKEQAEQKEIQLIEECKANDPKYGYNLSGGGKAPRLGLPVSEETRKKLSEANKGEKNYFYGKSLKGKDNWHYGRKASEEARKNMSEAQKAKVGELNNFYGFKHTEESKEKMREVRKGRYEGVDNVRAKAIVQYDLNGNYINRWDCMKLACEALKVKHSHISQCCSGNRKSAYGYRWSYAQ